VNFGKNATTYLRELCDKLEIAKSYAASHAEQTFQTRGKLNCTE